MTIADSTVLVTGANRGIGRALVTEALNRGAKRVYAGTRRPLEHPDPRVVPLDLDVTDPARIEAAAAAVTSLDLLVNNAGVWSPDSLGDRAEIERHLAVNLYGTWAMTRAFVPALTSARGAVVNILSLAAMAAVPMTPAYSISKAAALSLTQSQRALLADSGVRVHAVLSGPVDTDMVAGFDLPKADPASVAYRIWNGVEKGDEEIFPDEMSAPLAETWPDSLTKNIERANAAFR